MMCNLYSMTKNVDAIRQLFGALNSHVGGRRVGTPRHATQLTKTHRRVGADGGQSTYPTYDLPTGDSIRRSGQDLFSDTTANTCPGCILAVNENGRRTPQERPKMSRSVAG
ncbi:hypothetical protein [Bradyrhizobium japonicum]|uniref:hypothetical protein n=1 Tax=Bradyrhizobium japonicum TaxID=375 RepID=UPI0009B81252